MILSRPLQTQPDTHDGRLRHGPAHRPRWGDGCRGYRTRSGTSWSRSRVGPGRTTTTDGKLMATEATATSTSNWVNREICEERRLFRRGKITFDCGPTPVDSAESTGVALTCTRQPGQRSGPPDHLLLPPARTRLASGS